MSLQLASRLDSIQPSATMAINAKAQNLRAQGKKIINLSVGEPDFDTPEFIKAAAIEAINQGFTKYTAVEGIDELKLAIVNKFQRENALNYEKNQIIVSNGAKQSIFNACLALLNPGDEVIIPAPYWVSYPEMVKFAGAEPVFIETHLENRFKISAEQLAEKINARTKLFIINSPSNPSGMAYTLEELKALGDVLKKHPQVFILTDDMYEHIYWGEKPFCTLLNAAPELTPRTIVVNGVSKAYAMTGWRIGYAAADLALTKAMAKIQSQATSNSNSIAQKAAVAALSGDQTAVRNMCAVYQKRHDKVLAKVLEIPGFKAIAADGTFYLFIEVSEACKKLNLTDDVAFCEWLLDHCEIAVVPGSSFGSPGYIRISFATSDALLSEALERMKEKLKF